MSNNNYNKKEYNLKRKGGNVFIEQLKQRVAAKVAKIRYENRIDQFKQNRIFQNNQKRLYELIEGQERHEDNLPDGEESMQFWSKNWSERVNHNEKAEWLKGLETELKDVVKQSEIIITPEKVTRQTNTSTWKAPELDGLQGFWLKYLNSTRLVLAEALNTY